jgi:hypothetical protein
MKVKTIHDVVPYLDNFFYLVDPIRVNGKFSTTDKHGKEFQEFSAVAEWPLFKKPEKVLSKLLISHIQKLIDYKNWCLRQEKKPSTQWVIEWRIRPEYQVPTMLNPFAMVYMRFSIYPKEDK